MLKTGVVIIGAGHAGLSTSYCLKQQQIVHQVFEKGSIGEVWQSQRWDSFKLNTPNWANALPGENYEGDQRERFESAKWFSSYLKEYSLRHQLTVAENAEVISVEKDEGENNFVVDVRINGEVQRWSCNQVVVASGIMNKEKIPAISKSLPENILQLHASTYKNPNQLPGGNILVVGSAQSGCQVTEDLLDAGRKVFLSTGRVGRFPRRYRGKDIVEWNAATKFFDMRTADVPDKRMIKAPTAQVSGVGPLGKSLSLQYLFKKGATILGHLKNFTDGELQFDDNAEERVHEADEFSAQIKKMVDKFIEGNSIDAPQNETDEGDEPDVNAACVSHITFLNLSKENIATVIWTTGFSADFSWLKLPVLDEEGMPIHNEGKSSVDGLYFIGFPWLRSRKSGIIYGMKDDATYIASCVHSGLSQTKQD